MRSIVQFRLEDGFFFESQKDGNIVSFNPVFVAGEPKKQIYTDIHTHTHTQFSFGKTVICP